MKRLFFVLCFGALASCNDKGSSTTTETKSGDSSKISTTGSVTPEMPYATAEPYKDWQPGDKQNAVVAMNALKGWVANDIPSSVANFGDSVELRFDYFNKKFSKDSLTAFFTSDRATYADVKITMYDWESVISADKKTEYVTMWYKQKFTDKKGKTDSMSVVDDLKFEKGKIIELDEKIQHYPTKGK